MGDCLKRSSLCQLCQIAVRWQEKINILVKKFGRQKYKIFDDFVIAVTDYNNEIYQEIGQTSSWNPDEEVSKHSIRVVYTAGWRDEDDTITLEIREENQSLTMGRLLFSLNNATYDLFEDANHCFFEGLELLNNNEYRLKTGS
jgi:hypothetical protein